MSRKILGAAVLLPFLLAAKAGSPARGGWHPTRPPARHARSGAPARYAVLVSGEIAVVAVPPPGAVVLCRSAADCGDGVGHGAVCDEAAPVLVGEDERKFGLCRDACRDDDDCPGSASCEDSLDPENDDWAGCVPSGDDDLQ